MRRRFGLSAAFALCVSLLIAWQAAQVLSSGVIGVPGLAVMPVMVQPKGALNVSDHAQAPARKSAASGITTVSKTRSASTRGGPQSEVGSPSQHERAALAAMKMRRGETPVVDSQLSQPVESQGPVDLDASWLPGEPPREPDAADLVTGSLQVASLDAGLAASIGLPEANPRRGMAPAADSEPLPWANQPRPASRPGGNGSAGMLASASKPVGGPLPSESDIRSWVKAQAEEAVGGVDAEGMPLYRFDVWIEPPHEVRQRIASVAYDFDAPSAKPRAQASGNRSGDFRVKFGGASCARTVAVTITLEDGRQQTTDVDGCAILK